MGIRSGGCVGYVLVFNLIVVSIIMGIGAGPIGLILPSLFIAVAFMFIHMLLDILLLALGGDIDGDTQPGLGAE
jgi:hypothetical protein